jgi:hypothetical protein
MLGVRQAVDRDKPLGKQFAKQQAVRVCQADAVDEIKANLSPLDTDQTNRSLDPTADIGPVVRQPTPEQGLLDLGNRSTHHVARGQGDLQDVAG